MVYKDAEIVDCDMNQHVSNVIFARWFQIARNSYFQTVERPNGMFFVIAKIVIEYKQEIFAPDRICLRTRVRKLGNKSIEIYSEISSEKNGYEKIAASAIQTMICAMREDSKDPKSKTVRIPEKLRESIAKFERKEEWLASKL